MPLFLPHPPAPCPSELGKGSFSSEFVFCMINLHLLRAQRTICAFIQLGMSFTVFRFRSGDLVADDFTVVFCPIFLFLPFSVRRKCFFGQKILLREINVDEGFGKAA